MNEYSKMKEELNLINGKPKLLLHVCCAPCSSQVVDFLKDYFDVTMLFFNPNIEPKAEYNKRAMELEKICQAYGVKSIIASYDNALYRQSLADYKFIREGSDRCYQCYLYRMDYAASFAEDFGYDYFTTSLSISPYKKSKWINEIGNKLSEKYTIKYLYSDFKKEDGYRKSIILSQKYNLYRQKYCGCAYSLTEAKKNNIILN